MLVSSFLLVLGASALVHAQGIRVERSEHDLIEAYVSPESASSSSSEPMWHAKQHGDGLVDLKFHRLIPRQDISSADTGTLADATDTATRDTSAAQTTEDEATTTAEAETTTLRTTSSVTEASTTDESITSSTTATSTSTSSEPSSTSTTSTSTEPGASCYSTTVKTSTICETTGFSTYSCYTANITSSTCSPGLLCATQSSNGVTVCMELQNDKLAMSSKPSFDSLPLRKDGPPGNAWGLFGDNDECGMLNLLTPEIIAKAASEIRDGVRVSTDWPLNRMSRPCFGRAPFKHEITTKTPRAVNDDTLMFNTQSSSQWDGFRHYAYQKEKLWFNGKSLDELLSTDVNGIQAWVERGGVVGRGVLLDYASWADKNNIALTPFETKSITVSTLKEVAKSQGKTFQQGDILFIRTGWVRAYDKLSDDECKTLADYKVPPAHGIESSEETLRWLWEQDFAAVAGDQPSMEAWPCQNTDYFLHEWLLAGWGMPIGELFDLEALSKECEKRKRWSFFFSSMPLKVPGGVASPPNGVAIF
ncbi:putative cyclase-domain-containing protein [Fusarium redolens]|uniref:Cyclase-domain-containing protein n=1 Tax=Fusarium redolens TaxID=48865 RepID=A0A9P9H9W2_FUSRE|nr:putative cyclase-domain-containing protein [Fusarium redolens]KAH7253623.1 putative cyclase-domain-containing protein [Fusarium redolens]